MPITRLEVAGYRSVRKRSLGPGSENVIVGLNGRGGTHLDRARHLRGAEAGAGGA
jgi:hypothetical protein